MARILITPASLDCDPTEVAVPWRVLSSLGHEVSFATADGQRARPDELRLTGRGLEPWAVVPRDRRPVTARSPRGPLRCPPPRLTWR